MLADEINRTPPKTQAALLEAMQERQVSAGGHRHPLPDPFFVLATQNPIEQEGTYPLPEAQLDRFLFKVFVGYPDARRRAADLPAAPPASEQHELTKVLAGERDSRSCKRSCAGCRSRTTASTMRWRWSAPRAAAEHDRPAYIDKWIAWGAGPRAGQALILAAKARARARWPACVTIEDIRAVAHPVLRHRLVTTYAAQAEGQTPDTDHRPVCWTISRSDQERTHIDGHVAQVFRS